MCNFLRGDEPRQQSLPLLQQIVATRMHKLRELRHHCGVGPASSVVSAVVRVCLQLGCVEGIASGKKIKDMSNCVIKQTF